MAVTRVGLGGPVRAYPGFTAKAEDVTALIAATPDAILLIPADDSVVRVPADDLVLGI